MRLADKTVSRQHAAVVVRAEGPPLLTDTSSSGTTLNGAPLRPGEPVPLGEGDRIVCGQHPRALRVTVLPFRFTLSAGIVDGERAALAAAAARFGGVVDDQADAAATHLVLSSVRVTTKVALALARQQPIVTPAFVTAVAGTEPGQALPDPARFLPPVVDPKVTPAMNFAVDPRRATLLRDATVLVFSPVQDARVRALIEAMGGTLKVYCRDDGSGTHLDPDTVALTPAPGDVTAPSTQVWMDRVFAQMGFGGACSI